MQDQGCIGLEGHLMEEGQGELRVMQNWNGSQVNQIDSLLKVVLLKRDQGPQISWCHLMYEGHMYPSKGKVESWGSISEHTHG